MNRTFHDKLLDELKADIAARAGQAPVQVAAGRRIHRRVLAGAGVLGVAAAAAVIVPLTVTSPAPAYAVTKQPDGTVFLKIKELRDPEGAERELAAAGVRADITYLPLGRACQEPRYTRAPGSTVDIPEEDLESKDPAVQRRVRAAIRRADATAPVGTGHGGVTFRPSRIEPGQTVVVVLMENTETPTVEKPGVVWQFSYGVATGQVPPCVPVDDPGAFDIGDATPPPGS
ncbi:hypothetical protein Sru01_28280 [Sphaerisporangium rufum]|uniref:Uncharacterized protein n=1 Tax=Sphaerisporangium rufum TaxID=1381558 RepID=A0A919UYA4_9ACTN|nr:hypothetical protein [Sphaerisporangium rufum]GII77846.1 hypothetical protein Sru01_28280 [Sphaerisporangium rufum]